jgi:hypothetical protein
LINVAPKVNCCLKTLVALLDIRVNHPVVWGPQNETLAFVSSSLLGSTQQGHLVVWMILDLMEHFGRNPLTIGPILA